jgi:ATP-dependent helicase/nuclease subunit A
VISWSEAARALFALGGPTAVSAGAGSGKTTALVELCARLLSGDATGAPCDPCEIVAITFTEKAAAELEDRLRAALAERAGRATPGSEEERAWRGRVHGIDRMALGTIHAFAGRLLREHALEAGVDPEATVLDEETAAAWRLEAARQAVVAALDAGRPEARRLVAAHGAGGRRAGLAEMVAELVRERATLGDGPPQPAPDREGEAEAARAAALGAAEALCAARSEVRTPSGRAALEGLAERLAEIGPEERAGPILPRALRRIAALLEPVSRWRPGSTDGALARSLKDDLVRACRAFAPLGAEVLAGPQKRELCGLVAGAEALYAARKSRACALDFDDLLLRARDLLRDDAGLRGELRGRLRALLVDEYQDVNALQHEILELLAGGEGERPLLVAVGDLKQSIYRFRGADVTVFRGVLERFRVEQGARVLCLSANHRSNAALLELVNEVFARCMRPRPGDPRPYELAFGDEDRLLPVRGGGQLPAVEVLADGEEGDAAERRAREARAVAARIRAILSGEAGIEVRERGEDGEERPRRPRLADVAVLLRRLTQVREYERALRAAGVPYRLARGGGFYQAPEVRDMGELLASLAGDEAAPLAALLRSPLCGISDGALLVLSQLGLGTLARRSPDEVVRELLAAYPAAGAAWPELSDEAPGLGPQTSDAARVPVAPSGSPRPSTEAPSPGSTASGTSSSAPASTSTSETPPQAEVRGPRAEAAPSSCEAARLRRFLETWHALAPLLQRVPVHELLSRAVDALDLEAAHLAAPDGERRAANVRKVIALAERFAAEGGTAAAFAARLRRLASRPPREAEADVDPGDAVTLLSVHQAKGLEWPVVFVPDLGASPPTDARRAVRDPSGAIACAFSDPEEDVHHRTAALEAAREESRRAEAAESRRLLYVALTRARDRLVLSGEAGRRGESWRALVEAALEARPDLAIRVPLAEAATFAVGAASRPPDAAPPASPRPMTAPRLAPLAPRPSVRLAVTELAEYARCPRRVWLARHLRLAERGAGPAGGGQDDPDRATARGTLAHAMLSEADLAAPPLALRAALEAAASRRGYDPRSPGVRRIVQDVGRFLWSAPGRALTAAALRGALRREVPFSMRVEGDARAPACYLVGSLDAIVERRDVVEIIDFKYALDARGAAERYRFQVLAYALAASRARPGRPVRAALQFLRGSCATIDVTPSETELRRFAREAPRLAAAADAGEGLCASPAELGRTEARCRESRCELAARCWPAEGLRRTPAGAGPGSR